MTPVAISAIAATMASSVRRCCGFMLSMCWESTLRRRCRCCFLKMTNAATAKTKPLLVSPARACARLTAPSCTHKREPQASVVRRLTRLRRICNGRSLTRRNNKSRSARYVKKHSPDDWLSERHRSERPKINSDDSFRYTGASVKPPVGSVDTRDRCPLCFAGLKAFSARTTAKETRRRTPASDVHRAARGF